MTPEGSYWFLQLISSFFIFSYLGVVLATEKRITSVLIEPRSIEKIVEVDTQLVFYLFF
jgi:hypothetical protein